MGQAGRRRITRASLNRTLRRIVLVALVSACAGGIYAYLVAPYAGMLWNRGALAGALAAVLITSLHYLYVHGPYGGWLHRLPFALSALFLGVVYLAILLAVLMATAYLYEPGARHLFPQAIWFQLHVPMRDIAISLSITLIVILGSTMSSLLGTDVLRAVVLGRYHKPVREERIVALVDMKGSTALAERLGDAQFYAFLRAFIIDVSEELIEGGADIHSYIGDEILAVWPPHAAHRVLPALRAARARIDENTDDYLRRFGAAPDFRAAVHSGRVVVGEVGAEKRQIVVLGDLVNTAARIENEARTLGVDLLVSEEFLRHMDAGAGCAVTPLGDVTVRGRVAPVRLASVTEAADA